MSAFINASHEQPICSVEPAFERMDTRGTLAWSVIALCVYFPPLAVPVGALAAGAAISATRKHLAG